MPHSTQIVAFAEVPPNEPVTDHQREVKYLTEEQVTVLFRVIHTARDKTLFRLIYHRGLRASEPGLLMLADWDAGNTSLWVHRKKGSDGGRFFLLPVEGTAVRAWIKKRGIIAGPLFRPRSFATGDSLSESSGIVRFRPVSPMDPAKLARVVRTVRTQDSPQQLPESGLWLLKVLLWLQIQPARKPQDASPDSGRCGSTR